MEKENMEEEETPVVKGTVSYSSWPETGAA